MGRIAIEVLPEQVIDQIAAGEVVERPASVVKELCENALDAGATHITVELWGGGSERIRVLDNGCGMSEEEALLALRRHATSKLRRVEDLFGIETFGFRGEALPSIAAVSRMTLTTRRRGDESMVAAASIRVEGGRVTWSGEVGAPVGTQIDVADLLYNVPARRKFLRGQATETSHVADAVSKLALANPAVHFRLSHKNRTTLNAPLHKNAAERVRAVLGTRSTGALETTDVTVGGVRVRAFLAEPGRAQSSGRAVQLFVGRRPVRDRGLMHAVLQGYGELLPKGRYPVAVVFVDVEPGELDVNVHPQKLEVRFADAQVVYAAVRHAVRDAAARAPWAPASGGAVTVDMLATGSAPQRRARPMSHDYARIRDGQLLSWRPRRSRQGDVREPIGDRLPGADGREATHEVRGPRAESREPTADGREPTAEVREPNAENREPNAENRSPSRYSAMRYLGQLDRTYLVCEADGELVLLDQHVAHERVLYQRLMERGAGDAPAAQKLLFPAALELSQEQRRIVRECSSELASAGYEVAEGEGGALVLESTPVGVQADDPVAQLTEIVDELVAGGDAPDRRSALYAAIACHSVVRAGDTLSPRTARALLEDLDGVDPRLPSPHGRPTCVRLPLSEIARRFGR